MRRFLTLVCLFCLALPAGISISGCTRNPGANYCNGLGYGLKDTDVASITLQPQTTGISLAFGQTQQIATPSANSCKGTGVSLSSYTWGTTNNQLVDISPSGTICAGTWNRNTGGGIADYTICNFPHPLPSSSGLPYGIAYVTASGSSVTSNPVEVYVHAQVTSVSLVGSQQCYSQGTVAQLDSQACYSSSANPTGQPQSALFCKPSTLSDPTQFACGLPYVKDASGNWVQVAASSLPTCTSAIGFLNYSVGSASVGTINSETNQITANLPGTTAITAYVAGTGSSAGYFSTCPPQSISVTLANGKTAGTVTKGATQNLTTTVYDTNVDECPPLGCPITGLTLDYQSTNPIDISANNAGALVARFPGVASIYAICQPPSCNSAPINELGLNGTGLSLSSNPVLVTSPGTASEYVWFAAPGQSQYFVPISLLTGAAGSTVRLPYVPNSMVMDKGGDSLYFGSAHELMVYNTASNSLVKQDINAPGVVLAVSPSNAQILINDQERHIFSVYNTSSGSSTTFDGLGNAAAWTPDAKTLYITDSAALNDPPAGSGQPAPLITGHTDTLYVYNQNTGWATYPLPPSPVPSGSLPGLPPDSFPWTSLPPNVAVSSTSQTPAVTIPSVGAYFRGTPTVAHTWCPSGTVGNSTSMSLYPQGDTESAQSDVLAATTDGNHILSAAMDGGFITLTDIGISIPTAECPMTTTGSGVTQVQTLSPLNIAGAILAQPSLTQVNATAINQVVASPVSNLAFITYTGSTAGAALPYYLPAAGGVPAKVNYVTLQGSSKITAPLAGAFSPDNSIFFVSTAGDNQIHYISIPADPTNPKTPPTDSQQISPNLPVCTPVSSGGDDVGCTYSGSGTVVPATAVVVVPRTTT
jgi:hypothetical protein